MSVKKIKLDKDLLERAELFAEAAGYASVAEFITHLIEKEISILEEGDTSLEEVEKRLRGLGYIS